MFDYRGRLSDKPGINDDGDTVHLELDQGLNSRQEESFRLAGVHAPEKNQPGGPEAKAFSSAWLAGRQKRAAAAGRRWPFRVVTEKNTSPEPDENRTFVRYVATVYDAFTGECLNEAVNHYLAENQGWGTGIGKVGK